MLIADHPCYTIRTEPAAKRLVIEMRGWWTIDLIPDYLAALRCALTHLRSSGCPSKEQQALIDAAAYDVQSQDVVAAHNAISDSPEFRARRVAVVAKAALLTRQARRAGPLYRVFADHAAALAWLAEPE